MSQFIAFALIGLGIGGIYALVGQSIVLVHRGSGVLNFATGAVGMFGAYIYFELHIAELWPWWIAMGLAMLSCACLGAGMYIVVFHRLRSASVTAQIVATLGALTTLMAVVELTFAPNGLTEAVSSLLPVTRVSLPGGSAVTLSQFLLAGISVVLTLLLVLLQRLTNFGLATSAVAENPLVAASMGWSPTMVGATTWAMGSALAALGVILIAPISGMSVQGLALLVIPGMAAALVGRFESFSLTLLGAMLIGVGESEVSLYVRSPGWTEAAPLLIIIAVLALQGRVLPPRSHTTQRFARTGPGRLRFTALVWFGGALAFTLLVSSTWLGALATSLTFAIIILSIVVVTGFCGQLSLCQLSLAGVGAVLFAIFTIQLHITVWLAMALAVVATTIAGTLSAVLAVRTRGSNLAIVTLSLALVIDQLVVNNIWTTHVISIGQLPDLKLFGANLNGLFYPRAYAILLLVALTIAALVVANLRRSPSGRRLLAVRGNERAAASMGISVLGAKLYAFAVAAALAAVGGVLAEAELSYPDFSLFTVFGSIETTLYAVLGGVGWVSGAAVGSIAAPSGIGARAISGLFSPSGWLDLVTGLSVLLVVLQSSDGLVPLNIDQAKWLWHKAWGRKKAKRERVSSVTSLAVTAPVRSTSEIRRPVVLSVEGVRVRFGGQYALDGVGFDVGPGEIVGLIGPNGAGKSTMIDVICGFQRAESGTVRVDGRPIDNLSPSARALIGLSRSFQSLELFEDMTVIENLRVSQGGYKRIHYLSDLVWPHSTSLNQSIVAAIDRFQLGPMLDLLPSQLDYAHRRLVAIARALSIEPSILFLDEPAAGLDENERREFVEMLRYLSASHGFGILLVEHDVDLVFRVCNRVVALDAGRVIAEGDPATLRDDPALVASYLGSSENDAEVSDVVK